MKTEHENKRIRSMCMDLTNLLQGAGFRDTKVWYDSQPETIVVEGDIEAKVCVYASSTKACVIDIFRQLLPAVEKAV